MSKMIQIRDVPDDLHRRLKVRAAQKGMNLSDYLKRELFRIAERPTLDEMLDRLAQRPPIELSEPIEDIIRADRERH
jgi:plasmid stability protein